MSSPIRNTNKWHGDDVGDSSSIRHDTNSKTHNNNGKEELLQVPNVSENGNTRTAGGTSSGNNNNHSHYYINNNVAWQLLAATTSSVVTNNDNTNTNTNATVESSSSWQASSFHSRRGCTMNGIESKEEDDDEEEEEVNGDDTENCEDSDNDNVSQVSPLQENASFPNRPFVSSNTSSTILNIKNDDDDDDDEDMELLEKFMMHGSSHHSAGGDYCFNASCTNYSSTFAHDDDEDEDEDDGGGSGSEIIAIDHDNDPDFAKIPTYEMENTAIYHQNAKSWNNNINVFVGNNNNNNSSNKVDSSIIMTCHDTIDNRNNNEVICSDNGENSHDDDDDEDDNDDDEGDDDYDEIALKQRLHQKMIKHYEQNYNINGPPAYSEDEMALYEYEDHGLPDSIVATTTNNQTLHTHDRNILQMNDHDDDDYTTTTANIVDDTLDGSIKYSPMPPERLARKQRSFCRRGGEGHNALLKSAVMAAMDSHDDDVFDADPTSTSPFGTFRNPRRNSSFNMNNSGTASIQSMQDSLRQQNQFFYGSYNSTSNNTINNSSHQSRKRARRAGRTNSSSNTNNNNTPEDSAAIDRASNLLGTLCMGNPNSNYFNLFSNTNTNNNYNNNTTTNANFTWDLEEPQQQKQVDTKATTTKTVSFPMQHVFTMTPQTAFRTTSTMTSTMQSPLAMSASTNAMLQSLPSFTITASSSMYHPSQGLGGGNSDSPTTAMPTITTGTSHSVLAVTATNGMFHSTSTSTNSSNSSNKKNINNQIDVGLRNKTTTKTNCNEFVRVPPVRRVSRKKSYDGKISDGFDDSGHYSEDDVDDDDCHDDDGNTNTSTTNNNNRG